MKLQLALDALTLHDAIYMMGRCSKWVDVIEVGTPLIIREGVRAVKEMKKHFPNHEVLADLKIMDAGEYEASEAFEAGADIITVLGVTHDSTIKGCVAAAKKFSGKVMVDMICVSDLAKRTKELEAMGVDYICVHAAFDEQVAGASPLEELETVSAALSTAKGAVAGGLNETTVRLAAKLNPEIVVVGGGIAGKSDPEQAARMIKEAMKI